MGTLVGVALVLTSLSTAYLMRSDLMTQVDDELQAVTEPVARQALRRPAFPDPSLPTSYAFELQSDLGTVLWLPTGTTATPVLPDLPLDDPRVTSGEPFTVPSEGGRPQWRFVAGRVLDENGDLRRRQAPRHREPHRDPAARPHGPHRHGGARPVARAGPVCRAPRLPAPHPHRGHRGGDRGG